MVVVEESAPAAGRTFCAGGTIVFYVFCVKAMFAPGFLTALGCDRFACFGGDVASEPGCFAFVGATQFLALIGACTLFYYFRFFFDSSGRLNSDSFQRQAFALFGAVV